MCNIAVDGSTLDLVESLVHCYTDAKGCLVHLHDMLEGCDENWEENGFHHQAQQTMFLSNTQVSLAYTGGWWYGGSLIPNLLWVH